MGEPFRDQPFPIGALIGAAALLTFTLLAVTVARVAGIGTTAVVPAPIVEFRDLRFVDRGDGAVIIYDGSQPDQVVDVVAPGTNGFLRGVLRGMARERRSRGVSDLEPFRLSRRADGDLMLEDPSTGRLIELRAFGPTNVAAFARLLSDGDPEP